MSTSNETKPSTTEEVATTDANTLILGGLGIGAFGVISAVIGGAVCPACVVAAPALLGVGVYKRWKKATRKDNAGAGG